MPRPGNALFLLVGVVFTLFVGLWQPPTGINNRSRYPMIDLPSPVSCFCAHIRVGKSRRRETDGNITYAPASARHACKRTKRRRGARPLRQLEGRATHLSAQRAGRCWAGLGTGFRAPRRRARRPMRPLVLCGPAHSPSS